MIDRTKVRLSMRLRIASIVAAGALAVAGCAAPGASPAPEGKTVVVTYSVLGAVVADLVGEAAEVTVLMGDGVDPHDWSPSARDIERVMNADFVVANGLGLEENLVKTLDEAEKAGVPVFHATDHIQVREMGEGDKHEDEADPHADEAEKHAGGDPHFWVDPISMRDVVVALTGALAEVGLDVSARGKDLKERLVDLDAEARTILDVVPAKNRKLVTGHESMGYFAVRYAYTLVGAVIPGLTSLGEVSAGELADLKAEIEEYDVKAIFTEIGTPAAVAEAIAAETGVQIVELPSHTLPEDGSYFTFIREIATAVANALR